MRKGFIAATALAVTAGISAPSMAAEPLKVGVLATLEGTYTVLGEDGVRGLKTALAELGNQLGGRDVELVIGCLLYTSPSPRDATLSRMPSSA